MNDRDTMALTLASVVEAVNEYRIRTGAYPNASNAEQVKLATAHLDEILCSLPYPSNIAGRAAMSARADELETVAAGLTGGGSARIRQAMRGARIAILDRAQDLRGVAKPPIGERCAKLRTL